MKLAAAEWVDPATRARPLDAAPQAPQPPRQSRLDPGARRALLGEEALPASSSAARSASSALGHQPPGQPPGQPP
eukprot:751834-Pyramimonas_sp.AAC.1